MTSRAVGADCRRSRLPASVRLLVGAGFLVAVGYGIIAPALPTYVRSFGVGITAASLVVSAFAVFRLAFAPASGALVRRLGDVRIFCAGLLIVAGSSAACAFAADYAQLLTFRALGGVGSTMFTVSESTLLIRISPPRMRGRAAGAMATGFLLGSIAGPVVGGVLAEYGPRVPFLAYAAILAVVAATAATRLRRSRRRVRSADRLLVPAAPTTAVLRDPTFRAALAANFVNGWTVYGVRVALVPLFVVYHLGLSSQWSAAALAAFAIGTAATSAASGRLADHFGRRPLVLTGLLVVALSMCWLGFSTSPLTIVVAAVVSGAGTGITTPPTDAAVADVVTPPGSPSGDATRAAPALAAYQMVGDVGAIVGPVVAGFVAEQGGYPSAFVLTAVVVAVACFSWWRATDTLDGERSSTGTRGGNGRIGADDTRFTDAGDAFQSSSSVSAMPPSGGEPR